MRNQLFNGLFAEEFIESVEIGPDFRGEEKDLRRLKWLPDVTLLTLVGPKVTDAWLKHAAAMNGLSELHLYQAAVSDAGLAALANHPSLTQVGVYYTPIGDGALEHLQKVPGLNFLKLYGTRISRGPLEKFQEATGLAKIDHRKGAFMGVGCQNFDDACLISTVHENSPAQKAGLERDDRLVRFGKEKIADFDALTALISELDAGDEVEIEVERQAIDNEGKMVVRSVVTKVTLGPWELELAVQNGPRP
jgi:membrane-associated protease RseP (regulator of RpoE activity)